ncbi:hypothetical protein [Priestia megaterium]|nr:hypothetical protein [Priestia megaterium]
MEVLYAGMAIGAIVSVVYSIFRQETAVDFMMRLVFVQAVNVLCFIFFH